MIRRCQWTVHCDERGPGRCAAWLNDVNRRPQRQGQSAAGSHAGTCASVWPPGLASGLSATRDGELFFHLCNDDGVSLENGRVAADWGVPVRGNWP